MTTETKKVASDGAASDYFGRSVCMSTSGSVIISGAFGGAGGGTDRGAAYIHYGSSWATEKKLAASDAANQDQFGISVGLSGDGNTAIVGANWKPFGTYSGAAYVYYGTVWATEKKLTASDAAASDAFGCSVALSGDGAVAVVGASGEDGAGTDRGAAYVYYGTTWGTEKKLTAASPANSDAFGTNVAVSGDGSVVVVAAPSVDGAGSNRGAVYVYSGTLWGTETKLTASDAQDSDQFGIGGVSVSSDGSVIAVGTWYEDGAGTDRGAVYVYSGSSWTTETKIISSTPEDSAYFGSPALTDDGTILIVGSNGSDEGGAARGAVFKCTGTGWVSQEKLTASDKSNSAGFGWWVDVSNNGLYVVSGAPGDPTATNVGASYIYTLDPPAPIAVYFLGYA